jgi:Arc/MetJ family transcription regulator
MYGIDHTDPIWEANVARTKARSDRLRPDIRRKNLNIDQAKLDRARLLLGTETETETVDQALSALLLREELIAGVREVAGSGGVENVFDGDREP